MTPTPDREQGATLITVALCLLLMFGFTSLAIDGGFAYNTRRETQNAADNAALAAAWESCNPRSSAAPNPTQAALTVAAENGFDNASPDIGVVVTKLAGNRYQVAITTREDTTFGKVEPISSGSMTVVSQALADCTPKLFAGGYALFAGASNKCSGGVQLDLSGSSKIVNGGVHSNWDISTTGASTTINGPVTYLGASNFSPSSKLSNALGYPVSIDIADFEVGGSRAKAAATKGEYFGTTQKIDNSWMKSNGYATPQSGSGIKITKSGLYYTSNTISLSNVTAATGVTVTFVARNQISVSGSGDLTAYERITATSIDPGLLMFSSYLEPASGGPTCTGNAVQWSVSSGVWTGVIYAPNGQARQSAASAATLNGSVVAYTINLSGSDFNITWVQNPGGSPDFQVELIS